MNPADPMKKWMVEAGMESPGEEFHLSVLKKIEALPKLSPNYQPVISPLGWKLILGFIFAVFSWSILMIPADPKSTSLFDKIPSIKLPVPEFNLYNFTMPSLDFSPQFLLCICAFFFLGFLLIVGTIRQKQVGV